MKRASGYYWVSYKGNWIIAEYKNPVGIWLLCGENTYLDDDDFYEINENKIEFK